MSRKPSATQPHSWGPSASRPERADVEPADRQSIELPSTAETVHRGEHWTPTSTAERLTYRLQEVAEVLGISRRTVERLRSAGKFPRPDLQLGRMPVWSRTTLLRWLEGGAR